MSPLKCFCLVFVMVLAPLARGARDAAWPLPVTAPSAVGLSSARLDVMHQALRETVDRGVYSGYVTVLARDGKIADWRAYGWQDVATKAPMQKDSIVRIYSMTKLITATAALMLLEDGRLHLDDPVEKYLPALANRKVFVGGTVDAPELVPAARSVTILNLLTHTSGYYYDEAWTADPVPVELMKRAKIWEAANLDEFVVRVATVPLHDQPGTRFRYGISTDLLGAVVEKVSGQRLNVFFDQRIFGPLGMRDTGFWVPPEKRARLAMVYRHEPDGRLVLDAPSNVERATPNGGILSGGGGLYSTAADYVRFAQMLLNGGELDGVRLLGRKTIELMTRDHLAQIGQHPNGILSQGYGLGVRVVTNLGASTTLGSEGTFGWDGAVTTNVQIDPKEHTVALLLTQHVPWDEDEIIETFTNGYYTAIVN